MIRALEGPNRWLALLAGFAVGVVVTFVSGIPVLGILALWLTYTRLYVRRVILATDQAVVLLAGSRWSFRPRALVARFPVDTLIGPLRGTFLETRSLGPRLYVVPRTMREVHAADAPLLEE